MKANSDKKKRGAPLGKVRKFLRGTFRLTRINEHVGFTTVLVLFALLIIPDPNLIKFLILLVANVFSVSFTFMINDVEDAEDDKLDAEKKLRNPISAGLLTKKEGYILSTATALISFMLFCFGGILAAIIGSLGLLIGFLYSYKPVRLKSIPILDFMSHAFFLSTSIFLSTYFSVSGSSSLPTVIIFLTIGFYLISMSGDLFNEIRDFEVDKATKIKNFAQRYGLKAAEFLHTATVVLGGIISLIMSFFVIDITRLMLSIFLAVLYLVFEWIVRFLFVRDDGSYKNMFFKSLDFAVAIAFFYFVLSDLFARIVTQLWL